MLEGAYCLWNKTAACTEPYLGLYIETLKTLKIYVEGRKEGRNKWMDAWMDGWG